ncbi:MAG: ABC transporter permease [Chloroflexi bacterium]|nr:ABC transporter permease [Chloroflexota bacterium]
MASRVDPLETMPVSPFARPTRWLLWVWAAVMLGFLYLPIFFLVLFSFNSPRTPGLPIVNLTLHWYEVAAGNSLLLEAVKNSIIVAAAVAVLATTIGTMAAFPLVRGGLRHADSVRILATMPIMLPGILLGIAMLIFFRRILDLELSLLTVIAGHLVFTTPFVVLIVAARLQGFDRRLEWAAADLGASPAKAVRHIILPLISPAIVAGALISVTLSIDEFIITFFTVGPQVTLPLYIYTQVKFGVTPEVNAVATVLFVVTIGLLLGAGVVLRTGRHLLRRSRS